MAKKQGNREQVTGNRESNNKTIGNRPQVIGHWKSKSKSSLRRPKLDEVDGLDDLDSGQLHDFMDNL